MIGREITAAVAGAAGEAFEIQRLQLEDPREGEILVRIEAAGLCHTDLSVKEGHFGTSFPMVLGHESAGTIEAVGAGVRRLAPGDRVVLSFNYCNACRNCREGRPAYCYEFWAHNFEGQRPDGSTSLERDGHPIHSHFLGQSGFSTYAVCPELSATRIESDIPATTLAPFGCGVQTGAGSILNALQPRPGDGVAVFGVGAVGMAAVMAASLTECAPLIAIDPNERRRRLAEELGATHAIDPTATDVLDEIRSIAPLGLQYSLEMSGIPTVLQQAISSLCPGGTCGLVGAPAMGVRFSMDVHEVLDAGRTVRGIVMGESVPQRFLPELVELWGRGQLPVERIVKTFALEEIGAAARSAESGDVIKPVLRMG